MEEGGPSLLTGFADELRHIRLETPLPEGRESVIARLQAGFERVAADQRNAAAAKVTRTEDLARALNEAAR
jgi:hypothetical protein